MARGLLSAAVMHPLVFGFKRAHWASTRLGRRWLAKVALTPARFEYLYVLGHDALGGRRPRVAAPATPMTQAMLRRFLDVSRTTVSRMLRVLEDLGFVVRNRNRRAKANQSDARTRLVRLTPLGLQHLARALAMKLGPKVLDPCFARSMANIESIDGIEWWRDEFDGRAARKLRAFGASLFRLARAIGDSAGTWRFTTYLEDPALPNRAPNRIRRDMLGDALATATALTD